MLGGPVARPGYWGKPSSSAAGGAAGVFDLDSSWEAMALWRGASERWSVVLCSRQASYSQGREDLVQICRTTMSYSPTLRRVMDPRSQSEH